jgi:hypothetical protein
MALLPALDDETTANAKVVPKGRRNVSSDIVIYGRPE